MENCLFLSRATRNGPGTGRSVEMVLGSPAPEHRVMVGF